MGVLFQDEALFGSLNVYNNPRSRCASTPTSPRNEIREIVMKRLTEVGLEKSWAEAADTISRRYA